MLKKQFLYYKTISELAIEQLEPEQLFVSSNEETNSKEELKKLNK